MNKFLISSIIFLLIITVSCKKKNITQSPSFIDTTDIVELNKFKINEITFDYFQFKSKVDFTDGNDNQSFTVSGRVKRDSVIWLSITPGLGIEAARCLILKDSVMLLDRLHNKLYTYDFSFINNTFNTNLTFDNLQELLVGNLAFPKTQKNKLVKKEDLGFFLLRQNIDNLKADNYVSTKNLKIETLEIQNMTNNSFLSLKYTDFIPLDSFLIANHIKTVVKFTDTKGIEKTTIIDINHIKTEIPIKPLNFPFNVPKRFEDK